VSPMTESGYFYVLKSGIFGFVENAGKSGDTNDDNIDQHFMVGLYNETYDRI
jgi:hypothetical protein